MHYPVRKHPRLKTFDYAEGGTFFITICTKNKTHTLGHVIDGDAAYISLSPLGLLVKETILQIPVSYPCVEVLHWVIMPNHIHLLLQISYNQPISLFSVIRSTKSIVTRKYGEPVWQSSFFEHVVRNEKDALRCWKYIDENPQKWMLDKYYSSTP